MSTPLRPSADELAYRLRIARQFAREGNGEGIREALAGLRLALEDSDPAPDPVDAALAVRRIEGADVTPEDLRLVREAVAALDPPWLDSEAWEPPRPRTPWRP